MDKLDTYKGIMQYSRTSTQNKKRRLLKALKNTLGIIQPACKMAKVNRQTFYNWLKSDSQFKNDYQEILEDALDFAEASLLQQVADGNSRAIIFFLSHKAKQRGYSLVNSRRENHNNTQKTSTGLEDLSNEQLLAIINKEYNPKIA